MLAINEYKLLINQIKKINDAFIYDKLATIQATDKLLEQKADFESQLNKFFKIYENSNVLRLVRSIPKDHDLKNDPVINELSTSEINNENEFVRFYLKLELLKRDLTNLEVYKSNDEFSKEFELFNSFKEFWKEFKNYHND